MADNADIANDLMQARVDALLAARPVAAALVSALECESCGVDIPEARRLAVPGCQLCVDCQGLVELGGRHAR